MASFWAQFVTRLTAEDPSDQSVGGQRWAGWVAAGIVAVYLGLAWITRLPGVGVGNDDAIYVFLGKSLLQGSYREIFLPAAPPHVQYPPGFPLLLAAVLGVFGDHPIPLMLVPLVLSAGGLWLLFVTAKRVLPPIPALAVLLVAATNSMLITYGGRLKAEAAFFFFAMVTLWALAAPQASRRRLLIGCGAAIASAFMRSVGVAVIGAVLVHFVLARRWRWAGGFALAAALVFGPWLAWSLLGPRQLVGRSYGGDLVQETQRAVETGRHPLVSRVSAAVLRAGQYLFGHLHAVMGFKQAAGTLLDNIGWSLLLASTGSVGLLVLWRRARLVVLTTAMLLAVLALWPWADRRFLHPMVPLVGFILVTGAQALGRLVGRGAGLASVMIVLGLLAPGTIWRTGDLLRRGWRCDQDRPLETCYTPVEQAFLKAAVAGRALPDSAVVLVQREAAFGYHSGRLGVYASESGDPRQTGFLSFLRAAGITHLVTTRVTREEAVGLIARIDSVCDRVDVLGDFGEGTFLFGLRGDAVEANPTTCEVTHQLLKESRRLRAERLRIPDLFEMPNRDDR